MTRYLFAVAILAATICACAPIQIPQRTVEGKVVVSVSDPGVRIEILQPATYVGATRFVLFEVADCEIHLFVDADDAKNIRRLYWVQFEAYLPEHPTLAYSHHPAYSPTTLSGLPFYQRARFGQTSESPSPGSDAERAFSLLKEKGYTLPAETVNVTYKHFLDSTMRKELLLIMLEDMSLAGTTFAQLVRDNEVQPTWAPIAAKLLERAPQAFAITPTEGSVR